MPDWAKNAQEPAHFSFLDLLLDLCHYFPAYTVDSLLDQPVRRVWMMMDHVRHHREQLAQSAKDNPLAALALMMGS